MRHAIPVLLLTAAATVASDARVATGPLTIPAAWSAGPTHPANWTEVSAFGWSVASARDLNGDGYDDVIVGAPGWHSGGPSTQQEGRVHIFNGSPYGLSADPDWLVTGPDPFSAIGTWVDSAGDVNGDGHGDVIYSGSSGEHARAYLHLGSPSGPSIPPDWTHAPLPNPPQQHRRYGFPAAGAGDLNGDGYDDVILGVPDWANGLSDEGRAVVFYGSAGSLPDVPDWTFESDIADAELGLAAGAAGDVNGDGYDDVIIGSDGLAYVFVGSPSGLIGTPDWTAPMTIALSYFPGAVGCAGDVDGDGYNDVIVGSKGLAEVYHGSADGLALTPRWAVSGGWSFGLSAGSAGDVDGDGYDDVIVGAFYDGEQNEGRAFLFRGSASGLVATSSWIGKGEIGGQLDPSVFGNAVATAGDVNGDGRADVIVGSRGQDEMWGYDAGRAFVFHGLPSAVLGPAGATPTGADGAPLVLTREDGPPFFPDSVTIRLSWDVSCHDSDADYALYRGTLGDFSSHEPLICGTGGLTRVELDSQPASGSHYYLVVPLSLDHEGSYGLDGFAGERPPSWTACLPQSIAPCN